MLNVFRRRYKPADVSTYPPVADANLGQFAELVYGKLLPPTEPEFTERDYGIDIKVQGPFGEHTIPLHVYGDAPKTFLLVDHRLMKDYLREDGEFLAPKLITDAGFSLAVFRVNDVAPDDKNTYRNGVINCFFDPEDPLPANAGRAVGAWAWAMMRAGDYLADRTVAAIGHSRGGKTALWAGANDDRFPLVIANNSGSTGAKPARRRNGDDGQAEDIAMINQQFPHWFCENYHAYAKRDLELPVDQHQLLSLIKPRRVIVASATDDHHADPAGERLATELAGVEHRIRPGRHSLGLDDWKSYFDAFAAL